MYLWDSGTGALYLWENLAYNMSTGAFSYTQYVIADGSTATWNTGRHADPAGGRHQR